MACSESSSWLADTAVMRSCGKPRKLASGPARERTRPDASQHTLTMRDQRLASAKRASPPIGSSVTRRSLQVLVWFPVVVTVRARCQA